MCSHKNHNTSPTSIYGLSIAFRKPSSGLIPIFGVLHLAYSVDMNALGSGTRLWLLPFVVVRLLFMTYESTILHRKYIRIDAIRHPSIVYIDFQRKCCNSISVGVSLMHLVHSIEHFRLQRALLTDVYTHVS